jgi:riboflavin synthase
VFTGIIETSGVVRKVQSGGSSMTLLIAPQDKAFSVAVGGSVSVDGACLTLESQAGDVLYFTAVAETLSRTTLALRRPGDRVNLERAVPLGGRLDGHIVLGHVDAVGRITADRTVGDSIVRTVGVPKEIARFLAEKGSVAIDGVSLTVTRASASEIDVALVPFTLEKTTAASKLPGDGVNIECDVIARYLARLLSMHKEGTAGAEASGGGSFLEKLEGLGY